jgi:hypothetical protein
MSIEISSDSINKAYTEVDKYFPIKLPRQEKNIVNNDGMSINIPQDGFYDKVVNTIDNRRIILEKKSEILHDYYGDRLLTKDLFSDYISYKRKTTGIANLLSIGVIGANMYTRVLKNSVFLGKFGTIASIVALQATGRYFSNNWLEKRIETPWKIHNYRMSKGMGPTNLPENKHPEVITVPYSFEVTICFNT